MGDEWIDCKLGELGEFRNGVNFNSTQEGVGLPVIKVKDFGDLTIAPDSGFDELNPQAIRIPADQMVEVGDTLIIRSNGNPALVGRSMLYRGGTKPTTFSGFCIRFRPDRSKIVPAFAAYFIRSPLCRQHFTAYGSGTGIQNLSQGVLTDLDISLPPLPEQRAIARVLGGLDDKIELNRRMNRTLEDLARGLFRSWFVDFDPVTKNGSAKAPAAPHGLFPKRLVDSPLGPIPEGWRPGSVADLARYVNGRNFTKNATGTGRMVVRIAELNSGPGGSTVYNDVKAEPENVVQPGDLLFAWSGSLDVYRWNRDEALVNQHIFKVVCEAYPQWFVHFHLCEAMPFFQGIAADKATTMGHIKREHLRQAELALPPEPVLKYATQHIAPIYARLLANERESLRLAATRDALLPQLLSGEVHLAGASKSVEEIVA